MKKLSLPYISIWLPVLVGLLLLPIPLLGNFHVESALLAALAGCFWAGTSACHTQGKFDWRKIGFILRTLYLAGLPLFIFALFTGCFSWNGLGFWILYPIPSVLFGYAFGRMLRLRQVPYRKWLTTRFLLFVAIGIPLIEFFNLPQVYFYNHVWGGWPGPIYDETITISWPLVFFRLLTLLWSALFWFLSSFTKSIKAKAVAVFCVAGLILGYSFLPRLGIISPRGYIKKQLGGVKATPHFTIYYEKQAFTQNEVDLIALEHEFYFQQITEVLNIDEAGTDEKIESYLYANVRQKNRLTGAKFTSYVPVWLEQDQLHIAKRQLESLKHELVHVLAKQFGNDLLNASWSIGLVEGLAVALSGDISSRTTIHQIVAAEKPWPGAAAMKNALSLTGFYGGRATVNYTTTGSFIKYLLNRYPAAYFKRAYREGSVEKAYPQSFKGLVKGWHKHLAAITIDSLDQQVAARLFSIPSIFEQACPHVLSPVAQHVQNFRLLLSMKDTSAALRELAVLRKITPSNEFMDFQWLLLNLKTGKLANVLNRGEKKIKSERIKLLKADALAMAGRWEAAQRTVQNVKENLDSLSFLMKQALKVRENKKQWRYYIDLIYRNRLFKPDKYGQLNYYLQTLAIKEAIHTERWSLFKQYAAAILHFPLNEHYFETYLDIVHYLGFRQQFKLAEKWIDKIEHLSLRKRYEQRLVAEKEWIMFLKSSLTRR